MMSEWSSDGQQWQPTEDALQIRNDETVRIRGLTPGTPVRIGSLTGRADSRGRFLVALATTPLRDRVGRASVTVGRTEVGDLRLLPAKVSADTFQQLRADLERVWSGITTGGPMDPTSIDVTVDIAGVWERLADPAHAIAQAPAVRLDPGVVHLHPDRARRPLPPTPATVLAAHTGQLVAAPTVVQVVDADALAAVTDVLRQLVNAADLQRHHADVARQIRHLLRHPTYAQVVAERRRPRPVPHVARTDRRYRRILEVGRGLGTVGLPLDAPRARQLSIRSVDHLFELWTFLQVVLAVADATDSTPDYTALGRRVGRDRTRLESGTTITFADGTLVAYEPEAGPGGWQQLAPPTGTATPDIVVMAADGARAVVLDAKYTGAEMVGRRLQDAYGKYATIGRRGVGVVDTVAIIHPHPQLASRRAGAVHFGWLPGAVDRAPLLHMLAGVLSAAATA